MRKARLAAFSIAVVSLLSWTGAPASAQAAEACATLDEALTAKGLAHYAEQPALFKAVLSGTWVAGGDPASVTFQGPQIEAIKDISKVCVEAFADGHLSKKIHTQQAIMPSASGRPQQLQVVFDARQPSNPFFSTDTYTLVGILTEPSQIIFSYSAEITETCKGTTAVAAVAFVLFFYVLLAWWTYDKKDAGTLRKGAWLVYALSPVRITAGAFGDASLSQLQVVLFTFVVAGLLFQLWLRTGVLSDISEQLLMLLGISAVGAGGAKFTATIKSGFSDPTAQFLIGKGWYAWPLEPMRVHATLGKLMLTDGRLDVYKFQMAIFTIIVAAYVISAGQSDLSNVKISETMLYLIGISQGVYVGGKAVTDRTTDLESAVAEMMDLQKKIRDLTARINAVPAPANAADLTVQRSQRVEEYRKAARTAVKEYAPLTHRKYPGVMQNNQPVIDPQDGQPEIDPAVLEPSLI